MQNLINKLTIYGESEQVKDLQQGIRHALEKLWEAGDAMFDNSFAAAALDGLELWERAYGIDTDLSLSAQHRRENLIAKMRSAGTTTVAMLKSVAESYANGNVTVTEYYADYKFTIAFVSTRGIPAQMDKLKAAVEKIKPAHLAVEYVYTYVTHGDIKGKPYTHAQLASYTHDYIRNNLEV